VEKETSFRLAATLCRTGTEKQKKQLYLIGTDKQKQSMRSSTLTILAVLTLTVGNIICYAINGRLLHPLTIGVAILLIYINFQKKRIKE